MAISSQDISAIMAAQQAQGMNQIAMAAAITPGGGPGPNPVSVQTPMDPRAPAPMMGSFPTAGAQMGAGAAAGAMAFGTEVLPFAAFGIAGARERAMGLSPYNWGTRVGAGSRFSLMDPFTTTGRAGLRGFWGGAGINRAVLGGNQGLGATLRYIGGGNVGAGALGRGAIGALGGAALPLLGYAGATLALDATAGNIMTGAQEYMTTQSVLGSAGRMALPNMLSPGGVGFSPGDTQAVTRQLRGMAAQDPFTSMGDMQGIMASLTAGGHMRTVQNARQFQTKFRELTGSMKEIAEIYNTTMQEAAPILQRFQSMGYGTPQAAVGAMQRQRGMALAGGLTSQGVEAAGAVGAQISRAAGGLGTTGAAAMTRAVGRMGVAVMEGMVDPSMLTEATGGLTGEAANLAFSRNMYTRAQRLLQGRHGRHVLAYMMGEGGELDAGRVSKFMSGEVSYNQMLRAGEQRYGTADIQASYKRNRGRLGSQLLEQTGPMAFVSRLAEMRISQHGQVGADEDVRGLLMETFGQMSRSEADVLTRLVRKGGELDQSVKQRVRQKLQSQAQESAYKRHGSFEAFKRRLVDEITEPLSRPFREIGDAVTRMGDEVGESIREAVTGVRRTRTTAGEARLYRNILGGDLSQVFAGMEGGGGAASRSLFSVARGAGPSSLTAWGKVGLGEDSADVRQAIAHSLSTDAQGNALPRSISELEAGRLMGLAPTSGVGVTAAMQRKFNTFYKDYRTDIALTGDNAGRIANDMRAQAGRALGQGLSWNEYAHLSAGARGEFGGASQFDLIASKENQERFSGLFSGGKLTDKGWETMMGTASTWTMPKGGLSRSVLGRIGISQHRAGEKISLDSIKGLFQDRDTSAVLLEQMMLGGQSRDFFARLAMGTPENVRSAFESIGKAPGDLSEERGAGCRARGEAARGADTTKGVGDMGRSFLYQQALGRTTKEFSAQRALYGAGCEEMMAGTQGLEGAVGEAWGTVQDWYSSGGVTSKHDLYQQLKGSGTEMTPEQRKRMYRTLASDEMTGAVGSALLMREKRMGMLGKIGKKDMGTYEKTRRMLVGLGFVHEGFGKGKKSPERAALEAAMSGTPDREALQEYLLAGGLHGAAAAATASAVGGGGIIESEYGELAETGMDLAPEVRAGTQLSGGLSGVVAAGKQLAEAWQAEANRINARIDELG